MKTQTKRNERSTAATAITAVSVPGIDATAVADPFGVYELMASAGPMTATELAAYLHLHAGYVQPWLQWQASVGYLHRDGAERYAPYCALGPR